jgi:hypothetical protein
MTLADMPQHDFNLGAYRSRQGQDFQIISRLFEMSPEYDYWLATYDAHHVRWGHMRFSLMLPKKTARNTAEAMTIVTGSAADSVRGCLDVADAGGRPMMPVFSPDGWVLI